jgi:hypothetical protein
MSQELAKELAERLRPLNELRARVYLRMPMNYVLNGEVLEPRPSLEAEQLLASIDEFSREVIKDMEKRVQSPVSHFARPQRAQ